jgi:hypothetical protein
MAGLHARLSVLWRTPQRVHGPLLLGLVLYVAAPLLDIQYYSAMLRRGAYPTNADSIGLPIGFSFAASLLFAPVFLVLLWVALRRYAPGTRLNVWRRDRMALTWAATLGCLAISALAVESAIYMASEGLWLYALHGVGVVYFLAIARAAFLAGLAPRTSGPASGLARAT